MDPKIFPGWPFQKLYQAALTMVWRLYNMALFRDLKLDVAGRFILGNL